MVADSSELNLRAEQGAELSKREFHGPAHLSVVAAISRFHHAIGAPKRLTQAPPADTKDKTCKDNTTMHRTNHPHFFQNKYYFQ